MTERKRCGWESADERMVRYHDEEWGRPVHDDQRQFEFLVLESAQAGLSWRTILSKRDAYRRAYRGFDAARVARFGARDVQRLLGDAGIVRNRAKIEASISNARLFLQMADEFGSFDPGSGAGPTASRWSTTADPFPTSRRGRFSLTVSRRS